MTSKRTIILAVLLTFVYIINAQEKETTAQATFISPIGSNGHQSKETSNKLSLNVLHGENGGVNGFELAGLNNHNTNDVKGLQIAGISNVTRGNSSAVIIGGITNITQKNAHGFHLAGIVNLVGANSTGLQIAGISNCNTQKTNGFMLSGITNLVNDDVTGMQTSTFNLANKNMNGFQLGGLNFAKTMKGFQLGFINIADSIDGVALGFVSIARNGYFAFEASTNEVSYANLSYKMGSTSLYNIYTLGLGRYNSTNVYNYGIGIGTQISIKKRHALAIEGIASYLAYDNKWDKTNILNKANLSYQFSITDRISIIAGPSLNFYITKQMVNGKYGVIDVPHTIWEDKGKENMHYMWIGYNAGIHIKI